MKQWQTMTFCQRKVHEDAELREDCARTIFEGIRTWCKKLPKLRTERGIVKFSQGLHQNLKTDELTFRATNENKCIYYSLFCSNHRKVADRFKLGLAHQVEALACLIYINGPDKHHQFFQHLLSLNELPSEPLPAQFVDYCTAHAGGSVVSVGNAVRHRPHWMKPLLKAEMIYGLRVLLSIIEGANSGELSKEETFKHISREVKYAGDLVANHLLAVAVLTGLLLPRNYLTEPRVAQTLGNSVRRTLFHDHKTMTHARISKGVELASESLGISVLVGEHGLCETVRERKGKKAGHDAFHRQQDFVWIAQDDRKSGKISEMRHGNKMPKYRLEEDDRDAFHKLSRVDRNDAKHHWWEPIPERQTCLEHFVKECISANSDPLEVMYSSASAKEKSGSEENASIWRKYIAQHKIDDRNLPRGLRNLQLNSKVKTVKKKPSSSMKTKTCSTLIGNKRKD
jgi:hypothetical protein